MERTIILRGGGEIFQSLEKYFPIIGKMRKIFSNRWKMGKKFFQSLENFRRASHEADEEENQVRGALRGVLVRGAGAAGGRGGGVPEGGGVVRVACVGGGGAVGGGAGAHGGGLWVDEGDEMIFGHKGILSKKER